MTAFAAVDLGASAGRVMLADVSPDSVRLREVHRFVNRPQTVDGALRWDVMTLRAGMLAGLRTAGGGCNLAGIGVDSWAIDYALLDGDGRLLGNPVHYRDVRTVGVASVVARTVTPQTMYATTGVQMLPFNTIFQFVADRDSAAMRQAANALLIADLFGYWLTGVLGTELTNASTTGLLDISSRQWAAPLFESLGLRFDLFPPVRQPGQTLGTLVPAVAAACGLGPIPVLEIGSHDTASAVAAVPADGDRFAYISCGTWSLVGVELTHPVTGDQARSANFSNELGIDGTVRFLRNVMGLWLLQESLRAWTRGGVAVELPGLLAAAELLPPCRSVIDPDRPEFLSPGDMPARLRAECLRTGQPVPQTPAGITRCILDSLAAAYRRTVRAAAELSGIEVDTVHLVGGGAQNALLCQLTADACELPVIAGPVEATAYGNVLVQARSTGVLTGGLAELRRLVPRTETVRYLPGRFYGA